jgi:hypothetical protein
MSPEQQYFVDLATRTLEDRPEVRDEARAELLGRLAHAAAADDEVAAAASRLAGSRATSGTSRLALAAVALVFLAAIAAWQVVSALPEARIFRADHRGLPIPISTRITQLTTSQRELLAPCLVPESEFLPAREALWHKFPDDPALYEDYATLHFAIWREYPPDFRETWQRLDPDNGAWWLREAIAGERRRNAMPLADAMMMLDKSASADHFTLRRGDLRTRRLSPFQASRNLAEELQLAEVARSVRLPYYLNESLTEIYVFERAVADLTKGRNVEGYRKLISLRESLTAGLVSASPTLESQRGLASSMLVGSVVWERAARELGMDEEADRLNASEALGGLLDREFWAHPDPRPMSRLARRHCMSGFPGALVDPAEFGPGRLAEYALVDRATALAGSLGMLLLLGGALVESTRRGRRVNGLADGLRPLFARRDILGLLACGILLPAAWYLFITRSTPLGCRDIGFVHYSLPPALIQAGATLLFALLMLVQTLRRQIGRRAGLLGLKPGWPRIGWVMAAIAALVVPLAGGARWLPDHETRYLQAVAASAGFPLLWLLWEAATVLFSPREQALGGVLLSRRLIAPLALLAALLLACWLPLQAEERRWHARDRVTRVSLEHGGMMMWEARAVEWIRAGVRTLHPDPKLPPAG